MIPLPSFASAFVAGVVTFLAPCTLPLVPAYLGFLSGTAGKAAPSSRDRWRIVAAGFFFMLGFGLVLVALGTVAGLLGASAGPARRVIQRVGGVIIVVFGLSMLGVFRIPVLQRTFRLRIPGLQRLPVMPRAFVFGTVLGSGWTPCIGPILGTILFLAANTGTAAAGASLLSVYAIGLAIPFLLVAFFYSYAIRVILRIGHAMRVVENVAGVFLVFIGVLFLTGRMTAFIGSAYRILDFINYDAFYRFF